MHSWLVMLFGPYATITAAIFGGGHLTSLPIPKRTFGLGTVSALVAVAASMAVSILAVGHGPNGGIGYLVLWVPVVTVPVVGVVISKAFALREMRLAFLAGFFATLFALAWTCRLISNLYFVSTGD
jgi:hypothetical protein